MAPFLNQGNESCPTTENCARKGDALPCLLFRIGGLAEDENTVKHLAAFLDQVSRLAEEENRQ